MCIYIELNHFAVRQKLTKHCKSTILEFLKKSSMLKEVDFTVVNGILMKMKSF